MAKTLFFQQIIDSRYEDCTEDAMFTLAARVAFALNKVSGARIVNQDEPRFINWKDYEPCTQFRVDFYVQKDRRTKWNDIYKAINSVHAVPYKFINLVSIYD